MIEEVAWLMFIGSMCEKHGVESTRNMMQMHVVQSGLARGLSRDEILAEFTKELDEGAKVIESKLPAALAEARAIRKGREQ